MLWGSELSSEAMRLDRLFPCVRSLVAVSLLAYSGTDMCSRHRPVSVTGARSIGRRSVTGSVGGNLFLIVVYLRSCVEVSFLVGIKDVFFTRSMMV